MKQIIKSLLLVLCLMAAPMSMSAQSLVFHLSGSEKTTVALPATFNVTPTGEKLVINGNGKNIELAMGDVMCVTYKGKKGDANEDLTVDVADIATIISIMAGKGDNDTPSTGKAPKDAVAVDMGLPSGTFWANMNVGAEKPEDYGLFFAWGETNGYTPDTSDGRVFDWASYNSPSIEEGATTLDLAHDAAHVNWGGDWRMPTYDDCTELINNTTGVWTSLNGMNGWMFTSNKNGNTLFLPAIGWRFGTSGPLENPGLSGNYWTSTPYPSNASNTYHLYINGGGVNTGNYGRCYGFGVRPVIK